LGIGDWAQSPIPNPQSPIPNPQYMIYLIFHLKIKRKSKYFKINLLKLNLKMNNDFQNQNLLKSSNINSLITQQNSLNPLQFVSTPNFNNFSNYNNIKNNTVNLDFSNNLKINFELNNGLNNNFPDINGNELLNFELDQSTESIITNKSIPTHITSELSSNMQNINNNSTNLKDDIKAQNLFTPQINNEENKNVDINNNDEINDNLKYKDMIKSLEEKLRNEYLVNKEQNNYIEILKQTINNCLLKNGNINKSDLDNASKQLNKSPIDILIEYTSLKSKNETIKKQLVMQQILYNDMKNEIMNLKNENNILKNSSEKINKENKSLKRIKEEISHNYDILMGESVEIKNNLLKYEEEFSNCAKNNSDYVRLKTEHNDLSTNYEKQRNMLVNLQNDFNKINKSNNDLSKYNEKLVKENQVLKRELSLKNNELDNINNKKNNNNSDIKDNNDMLIKEKIDLINNIKDLENKNAELSEINENQKIEIDSLNKIINDKNNEIVKYLSEIECLKNNNISNTFNKNNNDNRIKLSSEINLDLIINNVQNELNEKNKLIEDLKAQNAKLIKENNENSFSEYILKESNKKNEIAIEEQKYMEQIERLNTIIRQKELEIYSLKNNEKSYNKIVDLSFQSIKDFINNIKNYDEFKDNDEEIINLEINDTNSENNNLFTIQMKEFVNKMNEENKNKNINNYYNGINLPLVEKIKKINIFINIVPNEINNLYHKIKIIHQENEALLIIKNKIKNKTSNITIIDDNINNNLNDINLSSIINYKKINDYIDISQSTPSIIDTNNKFGIFENIKRYNPEINSNSNNNNDNNSVFMDSKELNNIKNIQIINSKRNNIFDLNYNNPSENININLKKAFDEENNISKTNSNFISNKNKILTDESRVLNSNIQLNKIDLKIKEINNLLFSNEPQKSFIINEENNYRNGKKSRISQFKEETNNRKAIDNRNIRDNNNIFLSNQTSPEIQVRGNLNKIYNQNIPQNNENKNANTNLNFWKKLNVNQPITNRSIKSNALKLNSNNQNITYFHKRNGNQTIFEDSKISSNKKNILNSHTIDSSRFNTNAIPSLNDKSPFNKKKLIEDKNKKNELYQKSINGLADEVMKPSFLKSDVSMTMIGNVLNSSNNNNNESFLYLSRNKLNEKHKQNKGSNFFEIKTNSRRKSSPYNNRNNSKKLNNSLQRNKSFLC